MQMQHFDVELTRDGTLFDHAQVQAALDAAAQLSDLFVLSHGWNNNREEAAGLYDRLSDNLVRVMGISAMQGLAARRFGAVRLHWPSKRFEDAALIPGGGAASGGGDEGQDAVRAAVERLRGNPVRLARHGSNEGSDEGSEPDPSRDKIVDTLLSLIPALASGPGQDAVRAAVERLRGNPVRLADVGNEDDQQPDPSRDKIVDTLLSLIPALASGPEQDAARREFVLTLRALVDPAQVHVDDGSASFFSDDPLQLFQAFQASVAAPVGPALAGGAVAVNAAGAAMGAATGLRDVFSGVLAAARRLANFTTYNDMKQRAGLVGSTGAAQLLMLLRQKNPAVKLHLVGHSFGGRLVTTAANTLPPGTPAVTVSLLQAAYSHNGLAQDFDGQRHDGAFRRLVAEQRASGPIIITYTQNDRAVGIAYPLASRISHDVASSLGNRDDPYGGMGRNGAQHMRNEVDPSAPTLLAPGGGYRFRQGAIYNLNADEFIKDHGDVSGPQVAYAILNAVQAV
jgi:hypothetical protein